MTVLVCFFFIALLAYGLYMFAGQELPLLNLMIIGAMLWFGWQAYQNFHELTALWTSIKNFPDAAMAYAATSWGELTDGFTAWGWAGFSLALVLMIAFSLVVGLPSAKALAAVKVIRLERQLQKA